MTLQDWGETVPCQIRLPQTHFGRGCASRSSTVAQTETKTLISQIFAMHEDYSNLVLWVAAHNACVCTNMLSSMGSRAALRQCCSILTHTDGHKLTHMQLGVMHNGEKMQKTGNCKRPEDVRWVHKDPESQKKWQRKKGGGKYLAVLKYSLHKWLFTKTITLSSIEQTLKKKKKTNPSATVMIKKLLKQTTQTTPVQGS